ncbi:hypothetical protein ACO22_01631 [Paracoccidioides brasiliensis]|uniref:Uncharacterized protein n=1 Tax=Paracoccidioides brasiliensis TaxID=121759 RepID=A0A1D2JL13_PARBR|nr:hypothetical protein ACO22_01631 [Paracoccidioides brasiliensis]
MERIEDYVSHAELPEDDRISKKRSYPCPSSGINRQILD